MLFFYPFCVALFLSKVTVDHTVRLTNKCSLDKINKSLLRIQICILKKLVFVSEIAEIVRLSGGHLFNIKCYDVKEV